MLKAAGKILWLLSHKYFNRHELLLYPGFKCPGWSWAGQDGVSIILGSLNEALSFSLLSPLCSALRCQHRPVAEEVEAFFSPGVADGQQIRM